MLESDNRIMEIISAALREDVGMGDITTECTIPTDLQGQGVFIAKAAGVISGLEIAQAVFQHVDPELHFAFHVKDGMSVMRGMQLATVTGHVSSMLTGERVALNFLQRMSGIATRTSAFVKQVEGLPVDIMDTRKTVPGLRVFDRMAVRHGGGKNHRFGLDDMVLIKDNHVAVCGGVREAVELVRARLASRNQMKVEVEVDTLAQLGSLLECDGVDFILFDNFSLDDLAIAVRLARVRRPEISLEYSGNVSEHSVRDIAETGVNRISVGALTHSVQALDISFDILARE